MQICQHECVWKVCIKMVKKNLECCLQANILVLIPCFSLRCLVSLSTVVNHFSFLHSGHGGGCGLCSLRKCLLKSPFFLGSPSAHLGHTMMSHVRRVPTKHKRRQLGACMHVNVRLRLGILFLVLCSVLCTMSWTYQWWTCWVHRDVRSPFGTCTLGCTTSARSVVGCKPISGLSVVGDTSGSHTLSNLSSCKTTEDICMVQSNIFSHLYLCYNVCIVITLHETPNSGMEDNVG